MTTAATIQANLILDSSDFVNGMKKAEQSAESFGGKMSRIGGQMQKVGAMMTVGLTLPIIAFGAAAVKSAGESEAAIADLEAVLKSTGGVAGVTSEAAQELANSMQLVTKFSDEEVISAEAMLLTFTKIGKDVFPDATKATADMAQKFGMDMPQAAITLGKALNDPIGGVTALRRIGVMLTDEQEKQVKSFMAVNDVASAQKVILDELTVEVGGAAEAFGKTFPGQLAIFNNRLDTMKETIGVALIPSLIRFMDALTPIITAISNAPPWVIDFGVALLGLIAAAGPVITALGTIAKVVAFFSAGGGGAAVVTFITATLIPAIASFGAAAIAAIIPLLPILALVAAAVLLVYLVWKNWDQLGTTISQLGFLIKLVFITQMQNIYNSIKTIVNKIVVVFKSIGTKVKTVWKSIGDSFKSVFNGIVGIANKVFQSIANAIGKVIAFIRALIAALGSIKLPAALTPGSPTPFEMGLRGIGKQMDKLSSKSIPEMNTAMTPAGVSNAGGGNNVNITDNRRFSAGMDAKALRTALDNKLQGLAGAM